MSVKDTFEVFRSSLVSQLPMKDAIFLAMLTREHLFPGSLKTEVMAQPSATQAATYFLNNAISPNIEQDVNLDLNRLYKLLKVMEKHGGMLKRLAAKIKAAVPYSGSGEADNGASATGSYTSEMHVAICSLALT